MDGIGWREEQRLSSVKKEITQQQFGNVRKILVKDMYDVCINLIELCLADSRKGV